MEKVKVYKIVCKKKGKAQMIRYCENFDFTYKLVDKYERKGYNVIVREVSVQL